jgi:hypothetical protein
LVVALSLDDANTLRLTPESADIPWVQRGVPQVNCVENAEMPDSVSFDGNDILLVYATAMAVPVTFTLAPNDTAVRDRWGSYLAPFEVLLPAPTAPPAPTWMQWTATVQAATDEVLIVFTDIVGSLTVIDAPDMIVTTDGAIALTAVMVGADMLVTFDIPVTPGNEIICQSGNIFAYSDSNQVMRVHGITLG